MEYDGRDYNKKTCFPIVKKDNKKGKMKFIKINENIYRRLEILPLDVGINIRNINFTSLCESPVSMAICPLSYKSRHIFSEYIYFLFGRSTLRINRIHHKNCQRHPNKGESHHLIGTRFFTIKRHSQQEHQRRANVLEKA